MASITHRVTKVKERIFESTDLDEALPLKFTHLALYSLQEKFIIAYMSQHETVDGTDTADFSPICVIYPLCG